MYGYKSQRKVWKSRGRGRFCILFRQNLGAEGAIVPPDPLKLYFPEDQSRRKVFKHGLGGGTGLAFNLVKMGGGGMVQLAMGYDTYRSQESPPEGL